MEERYKKLKDQIRKMCKPSFIRLCDHAGLSKQETDMLVPFFYEYKSEDLMADMLGMSKSAYQKRKKMLMNRIMSFLDVISKY